MSRVRRRGGNDGGDDDEGDDDGDDVDVDDDDGDDVYVDDGDDVYDGDGARQGGPGAVIWRRRDALGKLNDRREMAAGFWLR
ncbi:MAG: hypothetical protein LBP95_12240 [Deltaproteobacteria bacterium]|nr:hypothetical protein [Deltaproteobacteria bacterium]